MLRTLFLSMLCLLLATGLQAQRHYKKQPRVRTATVRTEEKKQKENLKSTEPVIVDELPVAVENPVVQENATDVAGTTTGTDAAVESVNISDDIATVKPVLINEEMMRRIVASGFGPQLLKKMRPEKTAIETWLLIGILATILAAIFAVLSIIFALVSPNFTLFLVFLILAIIFGLGGSVIMTLFQFGVI